MTITKHPRRQRAALGAIAALTFGSAAVGVADQAEAGGFISVYFHTIQPIGGQLCSARVGVDVNMSESDARDFIAHPGDEATVKLMGDDLIWDNTIIALPTDAPTWPQAWAGGYSVEFTRVFSCHFLNEDWEGADEIYARLTFNDFRTGVTHYVNTANQVRSW
jgi:hypothetical protein